MTNSTTKPTIGLSSDGCPVGVWRRAGWFNRLLAIQAGQPQIMSSGKRGLNPGGVIYDSQVQNNLQD